MILRVRPAQVGGEVRGDLERRTARRCSRTAAKQTSLLQGYLGAAAEGAGLPPDLRRVELAMRYGNPDVAGALDRLRAAGCDRILVVPLYPQYAASTTASAMDAVYAHARRTRRMPALRVVDCFHDDPGYIRALARGDQRLLDEARPAGPAGAELPRPAAPRRSTWATPTTATATRPRACSPTSSGLDAEQYAVTFQSRFGKAEWLQPYTQDTLVALAKEGVGRVDVVCPGFVADCLETLEEIGIEVQGRRSSRPAARSSTPSPASTSTRRGSRR